MSKFTNLVSFFFIIYLIMPGCVNAQPGLIKQVKLSQFELQSSAVISSGGDKLSLLNYHPNVYWYKVKVPSTVLTGLVANKVYPDPYIGLNNMLIPDASDEFNKRYHLEQYSFLPGNPNPWKKPYWYRTIFHVSAKDKGRHFQLIFKGINYRAAVYLNGKQIADSSQMVGMFAEYSFDISQQINAGSDNVLAIKIYPLDYPGLPAQEQLKALGGFFENGGPKGDIGKNVTMLCSVGWDWIPPVRDRNMGIWQPVFLRTSGEVTIGNTKLTTDLPNLPDTDVARLSLKLTLANQSLRRKNGKLTVKISPENFNGKEIQFSNKVSIAPNSIAFVDLNGSIIKKLLIHNPHLWWPNGFGKANLYRIRLQYIDGGYVSDDTSFVFGIRTVSSKAEEVNGYFRRQFYVNGQSIHLEGGAWVPDMMLNRDSLRYDYELHLCRNANINLVRIWGGGVTPPDAFFDAADHYGLLVWSDFWVTGDTQGEFKGSSGWPLESDVFIRNMTSTIYRIRNHPSLLLWTGGNEGRPRKELYDAMRDSVIALDGTRPFIPTSSGFAKLPSGWKLSWPDNKPAGVYSGGPYAWRDPKEYYKLVDDGKDWVFKDETGLPSQPPYSSLSKIIPNLEWDTTLPFPMNNTWGYHDAATGNGKYDQYYKEMVKRYGAPTSMEDYSDKMQLMNAIGYQGIFEATGHKLNQTGGVMLWKLNAAFPSMIWQVYDWYLEPNAGYYFMQNACERIHIQLDLDDSTVAIVNRTHSPVSNLVINATVYNMQSKRLFNRISKISTSFSGVKKTINLSSILASAKGISFIVLNLKDAIGRQISHNVYWMAPNEDYKELKNLSSADVKLRVVSGTKGKNENKWTIQFSNLSNRIAFFIRPQLINKGEEILPSFWSSNYFTLAPYESLTVSVSAPINKIAGHNIELQVSGWNVKTQLKRLLAIGK